MSNVQTFISIQEERTVEEVAKKRIHFGCSIKTVLQNAIVVSW
jgi:hypothetical protein